MQLRITDYQGVTRWRWKLEDNRGNFIDDYEVSLDAGAEEYAGYENPPAYLRTRRDAHGGGRAGDEELLRRLGDWIGEHVFGRLRDKIRENITQPATIIRVLVPAEAQDLLFRPFELAHLSPGDQPLVEHGVRFIYQHPDAPADPAPKQSGPVLRVLTVFSLPEGANPLNLRRERHELKKLLLSIARTHGVAIEVRVLQYGATRATLRDALREAAGWDIIHFSGHGSKGILLLEDEQGGTDEITAEDLKGILLPAQERLHLLVLSACWSGAASHQAARAMLGLGDADGPTRQDETGESTDFPSLGQDLARELDCAVLAMRFPVGDKFAADLALSLYKQTLENGQPVPAALKLALEDSTTGDDRFVPSLSTATPILFGQRAAALAFILLPRPAGFVIPPTGLFGFEPEPERFVGRLLPMLRASEAFATGSAYRGVLFHGMAGGGKTTCALELAYRYEPQGDQSRRFQGYVFHKCPKEGADISTALADCLHAIEAQLGIPPGALTAVADQPEVFRERLLPRLKQMLTQNSILIVLDNLEGLLTGSGNWRDGKWGDFLDALLSHNGDSRLVLTSRRMPNSLADHGAILRESIHALSFAESVLLARELEHLGKYFDTGDDRELLATALGVIQGHPKLLELADELAADRDRFREQVANTKEDAERRDAPLKAFFDTGESKQGEQDYVATLSNWTGALTALLTPTARLLFRFLCRLEDEDRVSNVIDTVWKHVLARLKDDMPEAAQALREPGMGLTESLARLVACGLVGARDVQVKSNAITLYTIHPGVAEAGRAEANPVLLTATDHELGNFHGAVWQHGLETETEGGGGLIVPAARRAAPYLLRGRRWEEAAALLEQMIARDSTPATLNWTIPLLRRIAEATHGTEREGKDAALLAIALLMAGRHGEAEEKLREVVARAETIEDFRTASVASGQLANLLHQMGKLEEALSAVERKMEFTRRAGLGPWTQLSDEAQRLQILNAMGRWDEVLDAVEGHREQLATLPEKSVEDEAVVPWNVREGMLDTGRKAALNLERWKTCLRLNAEIVESQRRRRAYEVEIAKRLFNDYGPLLRLGRLGDAGRLLEACRDVFDRERDFLWLGKTYGAMADLEDKQGHRETAVSLAMVGLKYHYQSDEPADCAISHNNLSNYLERTGEPRERWLAHRLAAALVSFQTGSGFLQTTRRNLARSALPPAPPGFDEVADEVERIEGVRFREIFDRLPRTAPDGDAAIAAIWQLVSQAKAEREQQRTRQQAVLSSLPPAVQQAFELDGKEFSAALKAALDALPPDQRETTLKQLREAGLIGGGPDMAEVLHQFDPLLRDVAAVAQKKASAATRAKVEAALPQLEERGWRLTDAVQRIFSGERDADALTPGLDEQDTLLVRRILELL